MKEKKSAAFEVKIYKNSEAKVGMLRVLMLLSKLPPTTEKGPDEKKNICPSEPRVKRPQSMDSKCNIKAASTLVVNTRSNAKCFVRTSINRIFMGQLGFVTRRSTKRGRREVRCAFP